MEHQKHSNNNVHPPTAVENLVFQNFDNRTATFMFAPPFLKNNASRIAQSGFIFREHANVLQCYECGLQIQLTSLNDDPEYLHLIASPTCRHMKAVTTMVMNTMQLSAAIQDYTHPIHAMLLYQAVTRLQHYATFPTMEIPDMLIDKDSTNCWNNSLHDQIKSTYSNILSAAIMIHESPLEITYSSNPPPETPFQWYQKTQTMLAWKDESKMKIQTEDSILNKWVHLNETLKSSYQLLSRIDHKRFAAKRIEEYFLKSAMLIGTHNSYKSDIKIKLITSTSAILPISDILTTKINKLYNSLN